MASYEGITNTLSFAVALSASSAFPLDPRQMFGSLSAAQAAAAEAENAGSSNTVYYYGMPLVVFENDQATMYVINGDNTLKTVGSATYGDDKTIVLDAESGTLSLKSFGEEYFAYHPADHIIESGSYTYPDNMPQDASDGDYIQIAGTWYVYNESAWGPADGTPHSTSYYELTTGWKAGLEPKVAGTEGNYYLAWYEPSTTTLEGISSIISSLQTSIQEVNTALGETNETVASNTEAINNEISRAQQAEGDLDGRLDVVENAITVLNGEATVEGSVKKQVSDAIAAVVAGADTSFDTLKEISDWISTHADSAAAMNSNIQANATAISALETLVGELPEGISASNVMDYIAEAVAAEEARATGVEGGLNTRLTTVEGTIGSLGSAANAEVTDFATAAQGAKADTAVQKITADGQGNITVDSKSPINVYTLPTASTTTKGGVKVDGATIVVEGDIAKVNAVPSSSITGLNDAVDNRVQEAINDLNLGDTYLPKSDVVAAGSEAETVETASDAKAASEKLVMEHLTWKTTM